MIGGNLKVIGKFLIIFLILIQTTNGYSASAVVIKNQSLQKCFNLVGKKYSINPLLLLAIAQHESKLNPLAININRNGSKDIGLMQINSSWISIFKANGISEVDLYDPCINIYLGTWVLANSIRENGNNWKAVGAYNVGNLPGKHKEQMRIRYAKNIYNYYVSYFDHKLYSTRLQSTNKERGNE